VVSKKRRLRQYWSAAASTIAAAAYVPKNLNFVYFVVGLAFVSSFFGFLD